jgi:hypothetical protein
VNATFALKVVAYEKEHFYVSYSCVTTEDGKNLEILSVAPKNQDGTYDKELFKGFRKEAEKYFEPGVVKFANIKNCFEAPKPKKCFPVNRYLEN